ncbi:thiamine/thiamine pyrophosphate ABC transporter permease ThiP [Oricola sp.]|uniref:thiamine/thiamine pyrophosphate ABC transporter permease ThiP n=1 Tax=Oricola sp. TaxID=1979950 RepID=UPI0025D52148|nr:thiamine/thiamine pyrophosphate ABC transporter permease ThiP [Oricola sp.]MCI5075146.1 thiamine/thiamine pyrophosphate ABC transporter permease ThiP [Oricola sp.]
MAIGRIAWVPVLFLAALAAGAFLPLAIMALPGAGGEIAEALGDPVVWRSLRFTLVQALLSTGLSLGFAIPVAVALHEMRDFPGRGLVLRLFVLPLALPQIVAVLAIVGLYGERGALSRLVESAGVDFPSIYGLAGILLAHVFFNMPLAVRVALGGLSSMPAEYDRLAHQLGMGFAARFRHVLWPFMRPALMSAASLIFMLCVTSFTVVLTLGGGPRATTLEVAIYQALTFDFDIARAVLLALVQVAVTAFAFAMLTRAGGEVSAGLTLGAMRPFATRRNAIAGIVAMLVIVVGTVFVAAPFVVVFWRGLAADLSGLAAQASVRSALATSLVLGALAAVLAVGLALTLALGMARAAAQRGFTGTPSASERLLGQASSLILVVPPVVIAAGWFVSIRRFGDVYGAAPIMVATINAAMAVPFAFRLLAPSASSMMERYDRLCRQLAISGFARLRLVTWPLLRRALLLALAFSLALSLGDLGVIAIFGSQDVQTLPYLILQRMGSYRTQDAAGLALILCLMTMALMMFADRTGVGSAEARTS